MSENSAIEWTDHTFNPWIGCTKVSPACDHCYAESWDARFKGNRWGPHAPRTRTSQSIWKQPHKWNRQAEATGIRARVFCASLADCFDNHKSIDQQWRDDLWQVIRQTPHLDWQLLTKRPQNLQRYLPADWGNGYSNVWLGCTAENQAEFDRRAPTLLATPSVVRFLSMEPLLGPVDLGDMTGLHWVIVGGESGRDCRDSDPDWFRAIRDQCQAAGVAFFFKQYSGRTKRVIAAKGRAIDGVVYGAFPNAGAG